MCLSYLVCRTLHEDIPDVMILAMFLFGSPGPHMCHVPCHATGPGRVSRIQVHHVSGLDHPCALMESVVSVGHGPMCMPCLTGVAIIVHGTSGCVELCPWGVSLCRAGSVHGTAQPFVGCLSVQSTLLASVCL